ncbi:MAG TPA: sulfurtransferase [Actinomycetes bacterium]|nr:sulfurtransferase [Actinomycetes bacterium]
MASGPLITAVQLADELAGSGAPVVLDCRWDLAGGADRAGYEQGHLPGAVFVDLDRELAGPPGAGGRHPLPEAEAFAAVMRRAGVRRDRPVVAYDQGQPGGAARAWWLLGWFGHPDVRVLDGGLPAWVAAGLPLTTEVPEPEPGDFAARPGGRAVVDAAGAARLAAAGVLLDVRAPGRYQGVEEPVDPVAGHIPGARNLPLTELVGDRGLVPTGRLRALLHGHGVGEGTPAGAYCGSGVAAAHLVLALEVAGVPAALYVGSWSDWSTRDLPIETGG